ncbi:MAG: hypothetical protein JXB62_19260 [Pirellulales bacterium]|nr:hypothetical protein [Pirellulales bacterium]
MQRRWVPIGCMVAVNVAAQLLCCLCVIERIHGQAEWIHYSLLAVFPAHGILLAVWASLGGRANPWRLVVAVVGLVAWVRLSASLQRPGPGSLALTFLLFVATCLGSILLMTVRFLGAELTGDATEGATRESPVEGRWEQFSLRSLLSWTAATAIVLGSLHYLPSDAIGDLISSVEALGVLAAILGGNALIGLGAIWITLGTRWSRARYAGWAAAAVVAVALMFLALGSGEMYALSVFCIAQVVWITASLWAVRLAGYRLIWRRRVRL